MSKSLQIWASSFVLCSPSFPSSPSFPCSPCSPCFPSFPSRRNETLECGVECSFTLTCLSMFDWVWLSRVAGLGLVGTAAGSALFFGILGRTVFLEPHNRHPHSEAAIAPGKTQAVRLPPQPLPLLTLPKSPPASLTGVGFLFYGWDKTRRTR